MQFRLACPDDEKSLRDLHIRSSQEAYRTILPDFYLDQLLPQEKMLLWADRFRHHPDRRPLTMVLQAPKGIAGFAALSQAQHDQGALYLHQIFLAPEHMGRGWGRQLLRATLKALPDRDCNAPLSLHSFANNQRACRFYKGLGGQIILRRSHSHGTNSPLEMLTYRWPSARALLHSIPVHNPI